MKTLGYYNGKFDELDQMTVPMNDRASYFGDGVYDATYSRNYKIFALEEHIDRFFRSAEFMGIKIEQTKEELASILNEMLDKMDDGNQFVYFQVTRGTAMRNHAFPDEAKSNLWITMVPRNIQDTYKKVRLVTMEDKRFLYCNIKTINLLPAVLAAQKAKETAAAAAKKKVNPVRVGRQRRRAQAKAEKERRAQYFHDEAVKAAIERRKQYYQD